MRSKQAMQWHSSQTVVCRAGWQVDLQAQRWHNAVMAAPPTVMPFTTLTDRYCAAGLILCISSAWFWTYGSMYISRWWNEVFVVTWSLLTLRAAYGSWCWWPRSWQCFVGAGLVTSIELRHQHACTCHLVSPGVTCHQSQRQCSGTVVCYSESLSCYFCVWWLFHCSYSPCITDVVAYVIMCQSACCSGFRTSMAVACTLLWHIQWTVNLVGFLRLRWYVSMHYAWIRLLFVNKSSFL